MFSAKGDFSEELYPEGKGKFSYIATYLFEISFNCSSDSRDIILLLRNII